MENLNKAIDMIFKISIIVIAIILLLSKNDTQRYQYIGSDFLVLGNINILDTKTGTIYYRFQDSKTDTIKIIEENNAGK